MLGRGDHISGPRILEELRPFVGIKLLSPEHRDEILVAELILMPPMLPMVVLKAILNHSGT